MKAAVLAMCCGASLAARDSIAPVISLDLAGAPVEEVAGTKTGVGCEVHHSFCRDTSGTNSAGNNFVSKYSRTCEAGAADAAACSLPNAHAWDHRDGNLVVTKVIKLLNNDGAVVTPELQVKKSIDYSIRSEWAIEYDATDNSGNKAEQLIFTLILDDTVKPTLSPVLNSDVTVESCDSDNSRQNPNNRQFWMIPKTNVATDNIDGNLSSEITITTVNPSGRQVTSKMQKDIAWMMQINTFVLGDWKIKYSVKDHAGMFGFHGTSNEAVKETKVTVQDTTAPELYCGKSGCALAGDSIVQPALWSEYLISSQSGIGSIDECCSRCSDQEWTRAIGSKDKQPACGFFSYTPTGTCHLFARGLKTLSNNVKKQTGTMSGYPIDCRVRNSHECGANYEDAGAKCIDMRDSMLKVAGSNVVTVDPTSILAEATGTVENKKLGDHIISYSCSDSVGNAAKIQKRYVEVSDTLLPKLKITHNGGKVDDLHSIQHSAGYSADLAVVNELITPGKGYTCFDQCDGDLSSSVELTWYKDDKVVATGFDTKQVGTWVLDYSCADASKNVISKTRTIFNEDKEKPILNPIGADIITIEADNKAIYNDLGATCSDVIDGIIDHKVATSGDIVKTNSPGTYKINYYCEDNSKNQAKKVTRTVIVEDTKCPVCKLEGSQTVKLEAAFDFKDPSAKCTDSLDGTLKTQKTGSVLTTVPGTYYVTYKAVDSSKNPSYGANCKTKKALVRTIIVEDTLKPVITLTTKDGSLMQSSDGSDLGHGSVKNGAAMPSTEGGSNPYLMAEATTSVNGWIFAAVASAVTGVALLGFSARSSKSVAVPV